MENNFKKVFISPKSVINSNKSFRIFDCTIPKEKAYISFLKQRIDGAKFLDLEEELSDTSNFSLSFAFPKDKEIFLKFLKKHKIKSKNENILLYDQYGLYSVSRAWFIFNYYGFSNVFILDGGLPKWKKEVGLIIKGYEIEQEEEEDKNDELDNNFNEILTENTDFLTNFEEVKDIADKKEEGLIIDTRPYLGFLFSSKIPNSINIPYDKFIKADFTLKDIKELSKLFMDIDIKDKDFKIISSCGIGITACSGFIILKEILGFNNVKLYDGSIEEYEQLIN